jgi:ABC-type branched-subunit amino acid transport system ATPase component
MNAEPIQSKFTPDDQAAATGAMTGISLQGVKKSFGGNMAIRDCTTLIPQGCVSSIVGPNGAGKSTVFNLITGFVKPDAGEIWYQGTRLDGRKTADIYERGIARSFQGVRIFGKLTAIENLLLAGSANSAASTWVRPRADRAETERSVARAWDVLATMGLEKVANRKAGTLSFAEQKLLAIGRMMVTDAPFLLLDEPLSGLDLRTVGSFIDRIRALVTESGRSVCIVEHNLNAVRRMADYVIFMAEGTVKAAGPTEEVLERDDLARLYLGVAVTQEQ